MTEQKIDRRRRYHIVLDVETTNTIDDPLVYDVGFAVIDRAGNIYEEYSFVISEIFFGEHELMKSAYYAEKLPQYYADLATGNRTEISFWKLKRLFANIVKKYRVSDVYAYNVYFDLNALNTTARYLTKSKVRYFFPYGMDVFCIQHIACQTILQQKSYFAFAIQNNLYSPKGKLSTTAESAFKYISGNINFEEKHTGLEDVHIEAKILAKCLRQHKSIKRNINRGAWNLPQKKFKEFQKTA